MQKFDGEVVYLMQFWLWGYYVESGHDVVVMVVRAGGDTVVCWWYGNVSEVFIDV